MLMLMLLMMLLLLLLFLCLGNGKHGTIRGHTYATRTDYRIMEQVYLICINNQLYAMSNRMQWPRVEVLDVDTLQSKGYIQLGVDPEW